VTPLLKRMEPLGLLSRTRDAQDERRVLVSLSHRGRALRAKALTVPETMTRGQNIDELGSLRSVIADMVVALAEMQLDHVDKA